MQISLMNQVEPTQSTVQSPVGTLVEVKSGAENTQGKKINFRGAPENDEFKKDAKAAKNAGIFASVVGLGSLVVSGLMLKKANDATKAAKPVIEKLQAKLSKVEKTEEQINKFMADTGLGDVVSFLKQAGKTSADFVSDVVKNLGSIAAKHKQAADPATAEALRVEGVQKFVELVKQHVGSFGGFAEAQKVKLKDNPLFNIGTLMQDRVNQPLSFAEKKSLLNAKKALMNLFADASQKLSGQ